MRRPSSADAVLCPTSVRSTSSLLRFRPRPSRRSSTPLPQRAYIPFRLCAKLRTLYDISCSDRRRKSRTQCRKARYFAASVLLVLNHILQRSSEPSYLKELQSRREQHTAYHYEDYERKSPYIAVCYAYKIIDLIQRCTSGCQTSLKLYHRSPVLSMSIRAISSQRP